MKPFYTSIIAALAIATLTGCEASGSGQFRIVAGDTVGKNPNTPPFVDAKKVDPVIAPTTIPPLLDNTKQDKSMTEQNVIEHPVNTVDITNAPPMYVPPPPPPDQVQPASNQKEQVVIDTDQNAIRARVNEAKAATEATKLDNEAKMKAFTRAYNAPEVCYDVSNDLYFIYTAMYRGTPGDWYTVSNFAMTQLSNNSYMITRIGTLAKAAPDTSGLQCINRDQ